MADDAPTITCHEDTRKHVAEHLPELLELTGFLAATAGDTPSSARPGLIRDAADNLRTNFPGLDDLTLAAVCCYVADMSVIEFAERPGMGPYATLRAHVDMAGELAWELRGEL